LICNFMYQIMSLHIFLNCLIPHSIVNPLRQSLILFLKVEYLRQNILIRRTIGTTIFLKWNRSRFLSGYISLNVLNKFCLIKRHLLFLEELNFFLEFGFVFFITQRTLYFMIMFKIRYNNYLCIWNYGLVLNWHRYCWIRVQFWH
jgi:hypothetical protein